MMMLFKLISILAAHDSPFVCVTWDKVKKLRKGFHGFVLSANTQENVKQLGKAKHSQKVQEPQKDILKTFFCIKYILRFSPFTTIPKLKDVLFKRVCGRFLGSNLEIPTYPPSR